MRLGLGLYIVPLAFIANPALLYPGDALLFSLLAFGKVALGMWMMSRALIGGGGLIWSRPLWFGAGLAVIFLYGVVPGGDVL